MKKPLTIEEAFERQLIAEKPAKGIHTFSNGTEGYGWMDCNCFECWFYDPDTAGLLCAFEAALMANWVTPELAEMFGWVRNEKYPGGPWFDAPRQCPFFHQRPDKDDDGEDIPLPPDPDPLQLVLIADPTEDIAGIAPALPERVEAFA